MSKKLHSGLKRTLAWMLVVALMVQGCMVVYADDFSSEPEAVVSDESSDEDASAESDLEIAEDEDTSADLEVSEDSNEDMDSDVTVEEEQEDEAGVDVFSDGSNTAVFADGTEDTEDGTSRIEKGSVKITSDKSYEYTRIKDLNGYYRWAVANYPSNNSTLDMCVGEKRVGTLHALYTSKNSTELKGGLVWDKKSSFSSVNWTSSNTDVVTVMQYWANTDIKAVGVGEADVTGTWIGYDMSASSSSKTELGRVQVTYHVKVTEPPAAKNIDEEIELKGEPSSPELLKSANKIRSPWTLEESWGREAYNTYVDVTASDDDGMQNAVAIYKSYLSSGIINHEYKLDFHEMTKDNLETYAPSPSNRTSDLQETFVRPVNIPADGIYLIGTTPLKIPKRGNTTTISVQVFKDGAQTTTKPDFEFEFSDPSVAEVSKQSFSSSTYNTTLTVKALAPGSTTMTIKCGDLAVKTLEVDVNGVKITEPDNKIEMSLDDEIKEHQITYKVYDFTKADSDVTADTEVKWKAKDPSIAAIDTDGRFRIKKPGTTTIEANASVNNYSDIDSVTLTVTGSGSLQLDQDELKLKKDGTAKIKATATYNGSTVSDATIEWSSENEKVATVDTQGNVKAVGYGTTQITADWEAESGKTYSGKVTVNVVYDGLYVSDTQSDVTLTQNGTMEIVWQLDNMGEYVAGKTGKSSGYNSSSDVTWKSADEEIATVDKYGVIAAGSKNGQTTVTVTYAPNKNTNITKEIKVNVVDCKTVMNGETIDLTGTVGVDGGEHTWKNGYYENGHKSLGAQFWNTENNINAVGNTATAKVTGKIPALKPVGITHGFYVNLESIDGPCTSYETIRVKVDGTEGLYLDNTSIETSVGAEARPSIIGKVYDNDELVQDPTVTYKAEDESIVRLEEMPNNKAACYVVGIAPGKTVVTGKWGSFTATCDVTVTSDKKVILSPSDKLAVMQNGTETITAKAWDGSKYVDDATITWESYDESIATVKDGVVTGVDRGSVAVVAKWDDLVSSPVQVTVVPSRSVTVSTEWNDHDNQDGIRPEKAILQLTANNKKVGDPVELNADNNWTYEWKLLQAEDEKGNNIVYRVTADAPEDYTAKVTGGADDGFVVTYSHEIAKTSVTASVTWDDADDKDGIRPKSVSFQLKADGENVGDAITVNAGSNWTKTWEDLPEKKAGKALTYTVEVSDIPTEEDQYTVTTSGDAANGFVFKASHVPAAAEITAAAIWDDAENQDGVRPETVEAELYADGEATGDKVTLNAENNWTASFGEKELKKDGKTIEYTVQVSEVENYTCDVTGSGAKGFSLKYTHKTAVVNVTVSTVWNDKENQDGNRPTSYSVQLMADGVKSGDKITLDTANDFSKTWTGLQKYRTGNVGEEIQYTVEVSGLPETYESVVSGTVADGFSVTNMYVPTSVEIPVSVTWDDAENQDGARIEAVEAELYANGEATGNKVTLNAENNWTAKFASVDVKKDGTRIKYEVKGTEADGYDVSVAGDILDEEGLVLTYKHIPAVVNVSARASWNDANNQDGIRPTDTLVQLYADGTALGDKAVIESNKEWTKTWSNLPKYKAGKEIAYNVIAYAVSGYTVKVTGNALEGYKAEYTHNVQKMNVTVQNAWNDLDNVVDSRPAQLVVEIYANGKTTGKRVTLTEANNWKATVSAIDRNAAGKRIQYTGKAVGTPAGYNISVSTDVNGNIKLISNFTTYTKKLRLKLSKTSYVYNGKNAKPKVTVYNGRKKVSSKYYKVTYKNNKKVGYATVIVKGKGKFAKYAGKAAFTIKLKTLKKPSVKKGAKGTLNVSWKRDGQATKYVVQYSQSKKFKGKSTKTVTITNNKIGKTVLKGLTGKKNYYVRVRSCKAVNGREIWSSWSSRSSKVKVK